MKIKGSDFFLDGMGVFLAYIARKLKEDPNYTPHPLVRAFECAVGALEDIPTGETAMGVSGDKNKFGGHFNPYSVVLRKQDDGILVETIVDLTTGKNIPPDLMITIFRLQIHLDRFPGEEMPTADAVKVLNELLPGMHFYALGERWEEARDRFSCLLQEGRIRLPHDAPKELIDGLLKIRRDTPWEDYTPEIRSLIGGAIASDLDARSGTVVLTTPPGVTCSKHKILSFMTQVLVGQVSRYFHETRDCAFCRSAQVEPYVLAVWDNFLILADKHPLAEGHILVVTKNHVRAVGDLLPRALRELPEVIHSIGSFYSTENYGRFVAFEPGACGQSILHGHIHFLPGRYFLSQAIEVMSFELRELSSIEELIEPYKEHGGYLFLMENDRMFVSSRKDVRTKIEPSFFRRIIAGQLLRSDMADWRKCENNEEYLQEAKRSVKKLVNSWMGHRESK